MFKLIFCLRRLPHLSREEFQRYWRDTHGPLVRQNAAALRMRRYVQSHTLTIPANEALRTSRGTGEPYDGIAEIWWDSRADLEAALGTPEGRQADRTLREDERRFIDPRRSCAWFAEEYTVIED
jgi:uncharacterized protein (TIGR02118 family)